MSDKTFSMDYVMPYALCDHRGNARLSSLLVAGQQVSMEHCDSAGIGGDFFARNGTAFLLAKLSVDIIRTPMAGEKVTLTTRPNLPMRAQYRRLTEFSAKDEPIVQMDARWILVDIATHRVLRRLPEGLELPFLDAVPIEDFRATALSCQPEFFADLPVRYSMLDINRHVNNAVYGDFVSDALGQSLIDGWRIRRVQIFYHREALPGETVSLHLSQEGKKFFVRGTVGGNPCFDATGTLEKTE